jgi:hypothetical protein
MPCRALQNTSREHGFVDRRVLAADGQDPAATFVVARRHRLPVVVAATTP